MHFPLEPLCQEHFARLHDLFDSVCRERRFMAFTQAGPKEESAAYYQRIVDLGHTHFVATEGQTLLGWCDVLPLAAQMRQHAAVLGMGVAAHARGCGVGRALIQAAIDTASKKGVNRIELTVHSENQVAQSLYRSVGFQLEGTHKRGWCLDGQYFDIHFMARLGEGP